MRVPKVGERLTLVVVDDDNKRIEYLCEITKVWINYDDPEDVQISFKVRDPLLIDP